MVYIVYMVYMVYDCVYYCMLYVYTTYLCDVEQHGYAQEGRGVAPAQGGDVVVPALCVCKSPNYNIC
jgi:hypothetical protein